MTTEPTEPTEQEWRDAFFAGIFGKDDYVEDEADGCWRECQPLIARVRAAATESLDAEARTNSYNQGYIAGHRKGSETAVAAARDEVRKEIAAAVRALPLESLETGGYHTVLARGAVLAVIETGETE